MKKVFTLQQLVVFISFAMVLFSCKEELGLDPLEKEPAPEPLPIIGSEIFVSASIGGIPINFVNQHAGYGNGIDSAWYIYCSSTSLDVLKGQSFYFNQFTDTSNVNSIFFEFLACSPDTATDIRFDSSLLVGTYDFGSIVDTIPGLMITWIDDQKKVWKSAPEDTLPVGQTGTFTITDIVQNYDGFSEFIAAGTFEGIVYDTAGNSMNITNGRVVTRIGRNY